MCICAKNAIEGKKKSCNKKLPKKPFCYPVWIIGNLCNNTFGFYQELGLG